MSDSTLSDLPAEVLTDIVKHLKKPDIHALYTACKTLHSQLSHIAWHKSVSQECLNVEQLILQQEKSKTSVIARLKIHHDDDILTDAVAVRDKPQQKALCHFASLTQIELKGVRITSLLPSVFTTQCPNLTHLYIKQVTLAAQQTSPHVPIHSEGEFASFCDVDLRKYLHPARGTTQVTVNSRLRHIALTDIRTEWQGLREIWTSDDNDSSLGWFQDCLQDVHERLSTANQIRATLCLNLSESQPDPDRSRQLQTLADTLQGDIQATYKAEVDGCRQRLDNIERLQVGLRKSIQSRAAMAAAFKMTGSSGMPSQQVTCPKLLQMFFSMFASHPDNLAPEPEGSGAQYVQSIAKPTFAFMFEELNRQAAHLQQKMEQAEERQQEDMDDITEYMRYAEMLRRMKSNIQCLRTLQPQQIMQIMRQFQALPGLTSVQLHGDMCAGIKQGLLLQAANITRLVLGDIDDPKVQNAEFEAMLDSRRHVSQFVSLVAFTAALPVNNAQLANLAALPSLKHVIIVPSLSKRFKFCNNGVGGVSAKEGEEHDDEEGNTGRIILAADACGWDTLCIIAPASPLDLMKQLACLPSRNLSRPVQVLFTNRHIKPGLTLPLPFDDDPCEGSRYRYRPADGRSQYIRNWEKLATVASKNLKRCGGVQIAETSTWDQTTGIQTIDSLVIQYRHQESDDITPADVGDFYWTDEDRNPLPAIYDVNRALKALIPKASCRTVKLMVTDLSDLFFSVFMADFVNRHTTVIDLAYSRFVFEERSTIKQLPGHIREVHLQVTQLSDLQRLIRLIKECQQSRKAPLAFVCRMRMESLWNPEYQVKEARNILSKQAEVEGPITVVPVW